MFDAGRLWLDPAEEGGEMRIVPLNQPAVEEPDSAP